MSNLTINNNVDFVNSLEIELPTEKARSCNLTGPTFKTGEPAGYVDDSSIVSFVSGLSDEHKSDVLNSTLLAQLAANKKYDRWKDTEKWYKFYVDVLGKVGWVIQGFKFTEHSGSGMTLKVQDVILKLLASIATENMILIVTETMEALKALKDDDGRLVLFDSQSQSLGKGNFQIAVASEVGGNVATSIGAFYFNSKETKSRFLWFNYSKSDIHFFEGCQSITLNEEVYAEVRDAVIKKLGDSAKTFVQDIEI